MARGKVAEFVECIRRPLRQVLVSAGCTLSSLAMAAEIEFARIPAKMYHAAIDGNILGRLSRSLPTIPGQTLSPPVLARVYQKFTVSTSSPTSLETAFLGALTIKLAVGSITPDSS